MHTGPVSLTATPLYRHSCEKIKRKVSKRKPRKNLNCNRILIRHLSSKTPIRFRIIFFAENAIHGSRTKWDLTRVFISQMLIYLIKNIHSFCLQKIRENWSFICFHNLHFDSFSPPDVFWSKLAKLTNCPKSPCERWSSTGSS